jgi:hypothetical protein
MRIPGARSRGGRILLAYGLLVAVMAVWVAFQPWGSDPLDTSHALPTIGLGFLTLPAIVLLILTGVGAAVGRGTFLLLVVVLAWAEAVLVHRALNRLRARRRLRA